MAELAFYGAARTVTGSKYLLTVGEETTLVDAGLFQGLRSLRALNWDDPPFRPHQLSRVLLTHTHLDHVGYLPRLVKHGFRGPVFATDATADLARLLLMDSARIQEEDAESLHGLSGHGDRNELMRWMTSSPASPRQVYLTHGEPEASSALATRIRHELGWQTRIPHLGDVVEI